VADRQDAIVEMRRIFTRFGAHTTHEGLDLTVHRGEILGLAGGSGSGKTVLLREMTGLQRPDSGDVRVFGAAPAGLETAGGLALRKRWGVMFQRGGLFGSLSVRRNVGLPMHEHTTLTDADIDRIAERKLALTGLGPEAGLKRPDELSGGMLKRAALARAIVLDPELLILDEPTSGLDPASAQGVCDLILRTRQQFDPTIVIASHDLDLLWQVCDRVAVIGEGRVLADGTMDELSRDRRPLVAAYFPQSQRQAPRPRRRAGEPAEPATAPALMAA